MTHSSSGKYVTRIFLDEGHVYLGGHQARNWDKLSKFLSTQSAQRIVVTATLPPRLQKLLVQDKLRMGSQDQVRFIRNPTTRPELSHNVIFYNASAKSMEITITLSKTLRPILCEQERMIIFVRSIEAADYLSSALECSKYHSGGTDPLTGKKREGMSDEEKRASLEAWQDGRTNVIVATPALIQGMDYLYVRFVIFHEGAFGLMSYYQGAGRGGRAGERCDVFTVVDEKWQAWAEQKDMDDVEARQELMHFLKPEEKHCRVQVLTQTFDGTMMTCKDIQGQKACDVCEPGHPVLAVVLQAIQEQPSRSNLSSSSLSFSGSGQKRPAQEDATPSHKRSRFEANQFSSPAISSYRSSPTPGPSHPTPSQFFYTGSSSSPLQIALSPKSSRRPSAMSSIQLVAAANREPYECKLKKTQALDTVLRLLRGRCTVCWILHDKLVPCGEGDRLENKTKHRPLIDCEGLSKNFNQGFSRFLGRIRFQGYCQYCFYCGTPQDKDSKRFEPKCHAQWRNCDDVRAASALPHCPWSKMIQALLFAFFWHESKMKQLGTAMDWKEEAESAWGREVEGSLDDWADWLCIDKYENGGYWNGIEVILFEAGERGLFGSTTA